MTGFTSPFVSTLLLVGVTGTLSAATACTSRPKLLQVSLPDLARADSAVQAQARDLYASLTAKIAARSTAADDLGATYGRMGMVLQAAEYNDAAEPCYINAQSLVPADARWPYYLGHLYTSKGNTEKADASFHRVLDLQPDDVATLVWLGRLYLDNGRPEDAEPVFTRALTLSPRAVAVLAGLGRAALARRDFAGAVKYLEDALAIDPEAESLHSPLAIAYRGLGQLDKAAPHLKQWRNRDILVVDPLMQELDLVLESGLSYELRGVRALEAKDWTTAAAYFRQGTALARENTQLGRSLHHKLGTALFMQGDVDAAREQFETVVGAAPPGGVDESTAKAYYSLALLDASAGRPEAIEHFSAAVKYQPSYVEARLGLADALRRAGRAADSLPEYEETLKLNPRAPSARLGYAMALVRLRRYREAADWLSEGTTRYPDQPELALSLARLLAAAPDDRVRDGQRALTLVQELFKSHKSTEVGEAMAMTLAELGDYQQAAAIQRGVMSAVTPGGSNDAARRRMAANLQLYEQHRPCRTPWTEE
jgi:tetratricopeptide (TPR) repeat protein